MATPINNLPDIQRLTIDRLIDAAQKACQLGIPAIALFPVVPDEKKDAIGSEAQNPDNLICRAIAEVKSAMPELGIIADVALDPYTTHGHDGVLEQGEVANDATVELLVQQALVLAKAGCDVVAPSDMMDGRIGAIRTALEAEGFSKTLILSYAVKYASAFYGPFRDAVGSSPLGQALDKRSYQMDPSNVSEALREVRLDIQEGADMVMVKPGTLYLDVVRAVAEISEVPVLAYHVSGAYAMLKLAAAQGLLDEHAALEEVLLGCKRAGARAIVTYGALDLAYQWNRF